MPEPAPSGVIQLRFGGSGGQGLQLSAKILAAALLAAGRMIALSQSYEPTSRGGVSRSDIVIGDGPVEWPLASALDYLVLLDDVAAASSLPLLRNGGLVLADADRVGSGPAEDRRVCRLPFAAVARRLGNERVANVVALGALIEAAALCPPATVEAVVRAETPPKFLAVNLEALAAGRQLGPAARA